MAPSPDLSKSYAPIYVDCPPNINWIRSSSIGLSLDEALWVQGRKQVVLDAFSSYLERLTPDAFDVGEYTRRLKQSNYSDVPTLGLAISGGGWASAFTGTGALRALDSRLDAAVEQRTGGLLQSLTYISGLSGGGFPTVSFSTSNFPTADEIVDQWRPEIDRLSDDTNNTDYTASSSSMFADLTAKFKAGFQVSPSDYFGRAWGYEFVPGARGGLNVTFSSIVNLSNFRDYQMPFPILQLADINKNDVEYFGFQIPSVNTTIYDITPFEFGAWSGSVNAFTPTEWLGTRLQNGSTVNASACVRGFDRASYIMGSSAGAINMWYIENLSNGTLAPFAKRSYTKRQNSGSAVPQAELEDLVTAFQEYFGENKSSMAYANYPNPFSGLSSSSSSVRDLADLELVDGSESGQTIPLWGQIQPPRGLDLVIAWDSSQDGHPYNWNNGTSLYNTYLAANASGLPFPVIPPASTMINRNYSTRPVFFGCNTTLTTTQNTQMPGPIVLYLANAPYSAYTNFSYGQTTTSREQMSEIFVNSFNQITQGNGTLDKEWTTCLGCAAIDRSLARIGMQRTDQCERCMSRHCWDGKYDNRKPGVIDPTLLLEPGLGFLEWNKTHPF